MRAVIDSLRSRPRPQVHRSIHRYWVGTGGTARSVKHGQNHAKTGEDQNYRNIEIGHLRKGECRNNGKQDCDYLHDHRSLDTFPKNLAYCHVMALTPAFSDSRHRTNLEDTKPGRVGSRLYRLPTLPGC